MFPAPQPPRDMVMPGGLQAGLIVLLGICAAIAVLVLGRTAIRQRDRVPLFVVLGALLCVVYEPIGDTLVLAYYPEKGQITWVTLFGRGIPVFIGLMYLCYIGPFVLLFEHLRGKGFTARSWWTLWVGSVAAIVVIELGVMRIGHAWVYYGPQRTVVADLPIWTPITYVSFLFTIAAGVHALASRLRQRDQWIIIPAVPAFLAAAHLTTSLPAAVALYSTDDSTMILVGALGSIAVAALLAHGLSLLFVPQRAPGVDTPSDQRAVTRAATSSGSTQS